MHDVEGIKVLHGNTAKRTDVGLEAGFEGGGLAGEEGDISCEDRKPVLEGFLCDQHVNLFDCMFVTFLKMFRGAQDTFVCECLF